MSITGTGFTAGGGIFDGTVSFGANPATGVTLVSGTLLSAVSPAGAGTVDVIVTHNTTGASDPAGAGNDYTYIAPPLPIPTMTEWALSLLAALVAALAVKTIMDRRQEV